MRLRLLSGMLVLLLSLGCASSRGDEKSEESLQERWLSDQIECDDNGEIEHNLYFCECRHDEDWRPEFHGSSVCPVVLDNPECCFFSSRSCMCGGGDDFCSRQDLGSPVQRCPPDELDPIWERY